LLPDLLRQLVRFPSDRPEIIDRHRSEHFVFLAGILEAEPMVDGLAAVIVNDDGEYRMDEVGSDIIETFDRLDAIIKLPGVAELLPCLCKVPKLLAEKRSCVCFEPNLDEPIRYRHFESGKSIEKSAA
jgi:hypothetical protein